MEKRNNELAQAAASQNDAGLIKALVHLAGLADYRLWLLMNAMVSILQIRKRKL